MSCDKSFHDDNIPSPYTNTSRFVYGHGESFIVRIHVFKKKKTVFKDDILTSRRDANRLRYLRENYVPIPV
jgi:hypothetical protein